MDVTNIKGAPAHPVDAIQFGIAGMTCDKCVQTVERALRGVAGVVDVTVDRNAATASVTFERDKTDAPALHDAVLKSGYKPTGIFQR